MQNRQSHGSAGTGSRSVSNLRFPVPPAISAQTATGSQRQEQDTTGLEALGLAMMVSQPAPEPMETHMYMGYHPQFGAFPYGQPYMSLPLGPYGMPYGIMPTMQPGMHVSMYGDAMMGHPMAGMIYPTDHSLSGGLPTMRGDASMAGMLGQINGMAGIPMYEGPWGAPALWDAPAVPIREKMVQVSKTESAATEPVARRVTEAVAGPRARTPLQTLASSASSLFHEAVKTAGKEVPPETTFLSPSLAIASASFARTALAPRNLNYDINAWAMPLADRGVSEEGKSSLLAIFTPPSNAAAPTKRAGLDPEQRHTMPFRRILDVRCVRTPYKPAKLPALGTSFPLALHASSPTLASAIDRTALYEVHEFLVEWETPIELSISATKCLIDRGNRSSGTAFSIFSQHTIYDGPSCKALRNLSTDIAACIHAYQRSKTAVEDLSPVAVKAVQSWVPEFDVHDSHAFRVFCAANAVTPRATMGVDASLSHAPDHSRAAAWCRTIPTAFKLSSITALTSTGLLAIPGANRLAALPTGSQLPSSSTPAAIVPARTNERGERLPDNKMPRTSRSTPTNGSLSATSHATNGSGSTGGDASSRSAPKGPPKPTPEQSNRRSAQDDAAAAAAYAHGGYVQMPYYDDAAASMYPGQIMPGGFMSYPQYALADPYGAPEHHSGMPMPGYAHTHGMMQAVPAPPGRSGAGDYYNPDRIMRGSSDSGRGEGYGGAPAPKRPRTDAHFDPSGAYAAGMQAQSMPAYAGVLLSSPDRVMYGDTQ